MKTSLLFIWISFFIGNPDSAEEGTGAPSPETNVSSESSVKYDRLTKEVDAFLSAYDTNKTSAAETLEKTNAAKAELDVFQKQVDEKEAASDEVRKTYRKLDRKDRESKSELNSHRYSDAEKEEDQKKLKQLKGAYQAWKNNSDDAQKLWDRTDRNFESNFNDFKKTERSIQSHLAADYRSDKLRDPNAKLPLEPENLKNNLARNSRKLKKENKGSNELTTPAPSGTNGPVAPPTSNIITIPKPSTTSALTNTAPVIPIQASRPPAPLNECDEAQVKLAQLLVKDNPKILSDMVNLAALKMAYHMEEKNPGNIKRDTLEHYSTRFQKDLKAPDFQKKLTALYEANGREADQDKIAKLASREMKYLNRSLRLDNESASSILLFLSQEKSHHKFPITEADAAAVWAQGAIHSAKLKTLTGGEASEFEVGGREGNQLNFSTQVYGLLDQNVGAENFSSSLTELGNKLSKQQLAIQTAIEQKVKTLGKDFKCSLVKTCAPGQPTAGTVDLPTLQRNLATFISKGAVQNGAAIPSGQGLSIDLSQTKAAKGEIMLKLNP